MAEKVDGGAAANRPTGTPDQEGFLDLFPMHETEMMIRSAPKPSDKGGKIYRLMPPTDRFLVEGHPVIDRTGVRLTAEQAKHVLEAAQASGVRIVEVED